MTKKTWTRGHFHETILNNVLFDQCYEELVELLSYKGIGSNLSLIHISEPTRPY